MYSFAQRTDTVVYDEPLYGAYLKATDAKEYHPSANLIMETMECDAQKVVTMMSGPQPKEVAFFKNMTHHLVGLDRDFLKDGLNIILTRDPKQMLPSFDKVIPNPSIGDVGYADHVELVQYLEKEGLDYVVLDSKKILMNPRGVLEQLCEAAGIEFQENMLHWKEGARPEDGVWAKHWYGSVHNSTGYKPYSEKTEPFPEHLESLLEECRCPYELLKMKALS
jgi:hypothetical protein